MRASAVSAALSASLALGEGFRAALFGVGLAGSERLFLEPFGIGLARRGKRSLSVPGGTDFVLIKSLAIYASVFL
jgi:hypothetical protein